MSKSQRTKGLTAERALRNELADLLGEHTVKRHLGQSRDGGADLEIGTTWLVEVKRRARIAGVHEWMIQAQSAADKSGKLACIAFRADRGEWIFGFTLRDAIDLIRESLPNPAPLTAPWEDVDER